MTSPYHFTPPRPADLSHLAPAASPTFTGTVAVPAGTAAAPGLAFSGDADTGLGRPAANEVAVSTAGAERLRVAAGGNVGIGTGTPQRRLHAIGADGPLAALPALYLRQFPLFENNGNCLLTLLSPRTGTTAIYFADEDGPAQGMLSYSHATDSLSIQVNGGETVRVAAPVGAVNRVELTAAPSGGSPAVAAAGADGTIHLTLSGKGGGTVVLANLPTSAAGLPSGGLWKDASGYLRVA